MSRSLPGRRVAVTCAGLAAAAALLAGCGSDGGSTPSSSAPVTSEAPTTSSAPSSSAPPSESVPPSTSAAPTTPASSTPPATSATPTTPALAACVQLDVTATRVPGAAGITYGLISVTNRGSSRCALPGVPSVRLLDPNRSPVTAVATAAGTGGGLALDPGAVASTLLADRSDSCQASTRSAYVEIRATTAAPTVVAELTLPPCSLSVKPFVAGTSPAP